MKLIQRMTSLLLVLLLLCSVTALSCAATGSSSLTGNSSVQAGSSVTLTLAVGGTNIYGFEGVLSYGSGLSSPSISQSIGGYWDVSVQSLSDGSIKIVAQDLKMTTPISGSANLCTIKFTVGSGLSQGTALSAKVTNISMADNSSTTVTCGDCSWSGTVGSAPSSDNTLSALSCSNATLSPSFSKSTTYYTCSVPYSTSSLNLSYTLNDKGAKISVTGNSLSVGSNTINLVVTAANGSTKTYQIVATRAQDPDYKPSSDASLSALMLTASDTSISFSPAFSSTTKEYVAYVPNEITHATLKGRALSEKAKMVTEDSDVKLSPSTYTDLSISCTAEDGTTVETYTVHVFRMPAYNGVLPTITLEDPVDPAELEPEVPMLSFPETLELPLLGEVKSLTVGAVLGVIILALLFLLGFLLGKNRAGNQYADEYSDDLYEYPDHNDRYSETQEIPPVQEKVSAPSDTSVKNRSHQAYDFEKDTDTTPVKKNLSDEVDEYAEYAQPSKEELETLNEPMDAVAEEKPAQKSTASKADEEKLAEESVKNMSLDDLLKDIKNL